MDDKNKKLLHLLENNARESVSELARKLSLSRTAVQERIKKLHSGGIIKRFTVEYGVSQPQLITVHVMIRVNPKQSARVVAQLKQLYTIRSVYAISGIYDLIAVLKAENTEIIDDNLDQIGDINGVEKTISSIVLSTKLER